MRQRIGGTARRSPATSPAQYRAGSGVGVSVLLGQPHGFEGFFERIAVSGELHDQLVPDYKRVYEGQRDLDSAFLADCFEPHDYEDRVALRQRALDVIRDSRPRRRLARSPGSPATSPTPGGQRLRGL